MKKAFHIIKDILAWLILIAAIGMMVFTIFSVNTFDRNDRSVFGYKFFIVQSDSMSATDFEAGDIVFVKEVDPAALQEGDIIAYTSQNVSSSGETVTHKIRALVTDENGSPGFITYGTTTNTDDETIVTYPYVLGQYTGRLPKVGTFFVFLKTTPGYIFCILIPFLLLIGCHALNCILLFQRYKREQTEELRAERKMLSEERRQAAQMRKELKELRAQLAQSRADENQPEDASEEN